MCHDALCITKTEPHDGRTALSRLHRDALAEAMGAHRSTNFRHDTGLFAPNAEHLRAAARALRFPKRFFLGEDIGDLSAELT